MDPQLILEIDHEKYKGKDLIKVTVQKSKTPYHRYKKQAYIREGSSSNQMSIDEYRRRLVYYGSMNKDYSSTTISGATMSDLAPKALKVLRKMLKDSGRYKVNIDKLSDKQLLKDLLLIENNQLTIAALVLLGKESSLFRYLPFCEIRYGYKLSEREIHNQDMEIYKGGYLLYYNDIWKKIDSKNISLQVKYEMRLIEKKAFDQLTIREALNNAVAHRDYLINKSIFVMQFPSMIEVKSPGGFPEGITAENIIDESKPRNKLIADILFKCELVEQFGNGVNLMYKQQLSLGKNPPNFSGSSDTSVNLLLDGKIQDEEFAIYVLRVAEEKNKELSDTELIILNKINNKEKVDTNSITESLQDLGLIERVARNKYILSKKYYTDTNQKWEYTKRKGLSKNRNKELILQHIKDFNGARKQEIAKIFNFELTNNQIEVLLRELKNDGKIYFAGQPRSRTAKWMSAERDHTAQ